MEHKFKIEAIQSYWSERNELNRIKHFVTLTGEAKTIEEVAEQFGE